MQKIDPPRPCHYGPWAAALLRLENIDAEWPELGKAHWRPSNPMLPNDADNLLNIAAEVSQSKWPEEHAHLADFALKFLEADVMLFRSGYVKKHLLRRLQQADLDAQQTARSQTLLKRAVEQGAGLEEYREFCRLAAVTADDSLQTWLNEKAEGVVLTLNAFRGRDWGDAIGQFDEGTAMKLIRSGLYGRPTFGFKSDFSLPIVKMSDVSNDNRIKTNAWRMLRHVERAQASRPKASRKPK